MPALRRARESGTVLVNAEQEFDRARSQDGRPRRGLDCTTEPASIMSDTPTIDLTDLLDNHKLGRFHLQVLIVCGLCCFVTGFFVVGLGFIAPVATTALHLQPGALGPVFAAMGLGSFVGSLVFTPAADRFGRKPVILAGLLVAAPFLFLMGTAESVASLIWMQFFGGFAL